MTSIEALQQYIPDAWAKALLALPIAARESLQELRLRVGEPVAVSTPAGQ